ncbi:2OG-Fe(II) oxygenase [Alcaligenaceae bacterium]|nr:2OG-Fe(II) oxygenase [Alcaligenaceae bacterium]
MLATSALDDTLIDTLAQRGWVVSDELISPELHHGLLSSCRQHWDAGDFKPAAVGKGKALARHPRIRNDSIYWIEAEQAQGPVRQFLDWTETLRGQLNRELFAGLKSTEFHFARYPQGGAYKKHLDQHKGQAHRSISLVLYLNQTWTDDDGGQLCLYATDDNTRELARVLPQAGRLVLFRSDLVPHAVLPCSQTRWSLSGWFRTDATLLPVAPL